MKWQQTAWAALVVGTGMGALAQADSFDPKTVPGDAKWVIHIDMDALRTTKTWDIIDQRLADDQNAQEKIGQFETITGMRFPQDLHDVTLYGRSASDDAGVVLVHGAADREKISTARKMNPQYGSSPHGEHEVLTWEDKGKQMFGAFQGDSTAIIGRTRENVEAALDTLDGKARGLKSESTLGQGAGIGLLVYVAGKDIPALKKTNQAQSPLLNQMETAWISLGEQGDSVLIKGLITAKTAAAAEQMRAGLDGIKAMVSLAANAENADQKTKTAAAGIAGLTTKFKEKTVSVEWPISLDVVRAAVEQKATALKDRAPADTQSR